MTAQSIVGLFIFLFIVLPFSFKVFSWAIRTTLNPTEDKIKEMGNLIAEDAVPWWVGVMNWLSRFGTVGALLIVGFVFFLMLAGVIGG